MNVSFSYCEDILKTLPIGYYLGHPLTLKLEPTGDRTYIELGCERITIGFVNVFNACKNAPDGYDRESIIRSLLYHEVSHAILTPSKLFEYVLSDEWPTNFDMLCGPKVRTRNDKQLVDTSNPYIPKDKLDWIVKNLHDIINIFEDERIETLLNTYYMNTNFKRLVVMLNGDPKNFCDRDAMGRFFSVVRYRHGDPALVSRVQQIINKHAGLDNTAGYQPCLNYVLDIMHLMYDVIKSIIDENEKQADQNMNDKQPNKTQSDDKPQSDDTTSSSEQSTQEESKALTDEEIDQIMKTVEPFLQCFESEEELLATKKTLKGLTTNPDATAVKTKVNKILNAILNKQKNLSSGSYAYAGRIDPRATLNRDYKWFAKKNQGSAAKRFNKVRFNLFVDSSGSFHGSENAINALICSLKQIESTNPDFSVRVAHCGAGTVLAPVDNPYVSCENFSQLGHNTKKIYDSIQQPQASNVNIVVFDGRMAGRFNGGNAYSAFDHSNCIIVSDDANEEDIRRFAPSAKAIILQCGYANAFIDVVLKQIESMLS